LLFQLKTSQGFCSTLGLCHAIIWQIRKSRKLQTCQNDQESG
jgi:hypothetical protein